MKRPTLAVTVEAKVEDPGLPATAVSFDAPEPALRVSRWLVEHLLRGRCPPPRAGLDPVRQHRTNDVSPTTPPESQRRGRRGRAARESNASVRRRAIAGRQRRQ